MQRGWSNTLRGRFLVFDGPDGSGKSTQIRRFVEAVLADGTQVSDVREPGGTPIGEKVRTILLDPANAEMDVRCEMLLYMASRAQLMVERVRPALEAGHMVLSDRFISSTLAYQGTAGGVSPSEILTVAEVAIGGRWPDLTVVFDVDETVALSRLSPHLDRMERKGVEFHRRVRAGYLEQARERPDRYLVVDASQSADQVFDALIAGVIAHWPR